MHGVRKTIVGNQQDAIAKSNAIPKHSSTEEVRRLICVRISITNTTMKGAGDKQEYVITHTPAADRQKTIGRR